MPGQALDQVGPNAGFLFQLAKRGGPRLLLVGDSALRHRPGVVRIIDPRADPDFAVAVEEPDSGAEPVEMVVVAHFPSPSVGERGRLRCSNDRATRGTCSRVT